MFFTAPSLEKQEVRAILAQDLGYVALFAHAIVTLEDYIF
jgi:hypothetical protein